MILKFLVLVVRGGLHLSKAGIREKGAVPEESGHFARTQSLGAPCRVKGHPSGDQQQATELDHPEPREEKWAEDVDLGDGRTHVCGFQVFLLESQLEPQTQTVPLLHAVRQMFCTSFFFI